MSRDVELRWLRWDRLIIKEDYYKVVEEFDGMLRSGDELTIGDMVRRDQALESMDILPIKNYKYKKEKK